MKKHQTAAAERYKEELKQENPVLLILLAVGCAILIALPILSQRLNGNSRVADNRLLTPPPKPTPILIPADTLPKGSKNDMNVYKNQHMSIEVPSDWTVIDYGNQPMDYSKSKSHILLTPKSVDPISTSQFKDPTVDFINIELTNIYHGKPWSDITSRESFFDINSKLWTETMRQSGGGGDLMVTVQPASIGKQKAMQKTNTWTNVIESFESVDYYYFFPAVYPTSEVFVWSIQYRLPLSLPKENDRKEKIESLLSTLMIY